GTAAYLSSNQDAFTSRTAGFIIQQHFPPGVRGAPPGPLVGVGFSNLFFSDVNRFKAIPPGFDPLSLAPTPDAPGDPQTKQISPGVRGAAVALTSLNDSPGGVPLYKNGELVGAIGVTGDGSPTDLSPAAAIFARQTQRTATPGFKAGHDTDEDVALVGQTGFRPPDEILATNVLINGIRVPYVDPGMTNIPDASNVQPLGSIGKAVAGFPVQAPPPPFPYPAATFDGVNGEIRQPIRNDPLPGTIGKARRLDAGEVESILGLAAVRCTETRAGIRLPLGTKAKVFISVVNNPHKNGVAPQVLGCFRVGEATLFSWDVCVQKARTAVFFSNKQLAQSCRTVGFLAQRYFPPGIDGRSWGPYFGFQEAVSLKTSPIAHKFPGNPNLPNGITIFPGGFPLYRGGELIGAIGVSGDGVDQDDIITASGCADFLPPQRIRADNYTYRGARLPYAKFPRDPEE
ncbi:MAG TPA: heme-binding protein, partial [Chthoniobacteraceae bacterium]|nr:heme-binding protein [Chthoniobacteraceae bacterium]